jgi:hypothetical protein
MSRKGNCWDNAPMGASRHDQGLAARPPMTRTPAPIKADCQRIGRLALDNNPAERALRGVAVGRKNWLFAGSDARGRRAAAMYSLIESAKLNDINQHYLADVLARIADYPARHIAELLPRNWKPAEPQRAAA